MQKNYRFQQILVLVILLGLFWCVLDTLKKRNMAALLICFILLLLEVILGIIIIVERRKADHIYRVLTQFSIDEMFTKKNAFSEEIAELDPIMEHIKEEYKKSINLYPDQYLLLQNQINPHFLYNTLDSIRFLAIKSGSDDVAVMVEKMARFFRYSISGYDTSQSLDSELNNIQDYFYIQKIRFGSKLELELDISDNKLLNQHIPRMTLQPIVENAIFHGLETKTQEGKVTIRIFSSGKKVYIIIADNGIGMDDKQVNLLNEKINKPFSMQNKRVNIGLTNVNIRIKKMYGEEFGLHITSIKDIGTNIQVLIPYVEGR